MSKKIAQKIPSTRSLNLWLQKIQVRFTIRNTLRKRNVNNSHQISNFIQMVHRPIITRTMSTYFNIMHFVWVCARVCSQMNINGFHITNYNHSNYDNICPMGISVTFGYTEFHIYYQKKKIDRIVRRKKHVESPKWYNMKWEERLYSFFSLFANTRSTLYQQM